MPINVYLTLDVFLGRWYGDQKEIWACVTPHIQFADLATYITTAIWYDGGPGNSTNVAYSYMPADATSRFVDANGATTLIPVPFPNDVNLTFSLASPKKAPVVVPRNGVRIADQAAADAFAALNSAATAYLDDAAQKQMRDANAHLAGQSFAYAYYASIYDMYQLVMNPPAPSPTRPSPPPSLDQIADFLKVGLWGGLRRNVFTDRRMTLPDMVSVYSLIPPDVSDPAAMTTNLHSLLGFMAKIADGHDDIAALTDPNNFLDVTPATATVNTPLPLDPKAQAAFGVMFASLDKAPDASKTISVAFDSAYGRRVYLQDVGTAFTLQNIQAAGSTAAAPIGRAIYRRRQQPDAGDSLMPSEMKRLIVGVAAGQVPPAGFDDAANATVTLKLLRIYRCTLRPYRNAPPETGILEMRATGGQKYIDELADAMATNATVSLYLPADGSLLYSGPPPPQAAQIAAVMPPSPPTGGPRTLTPLRILNVGWDSGAKILCFDSFAAQLGKGGPADLREVIVVFERPARTFSATRTGLTATGDYSGLRWMTDELDLTDGTAATDSFNAIEIVAPASMTPFASLAPIAVYRRNVSFHYAQSVGLFSGAITVNYPSVPIVDASDNTAPNHFAHDLINYNALNVSADGQHLNPNTEIYPVKRTDTEHGFRVRHAIAAADPPQVIVTVADTAVPPQTYIYPTAHVEPRLHYKQIFTTAKNGRSVSVNLEHTYGDRIDREPGKPPWITSPAASLDFPVSLFTNVSAHEPGASPSDPRTPFIKIAVNDTTKVVTLTFATWMLQAPPPPDTSSPSIAANIAAYNERYLAYVAAWRAVADSAFAQAISVEAEFLQFDFSHMFDNPPQVGSVDGTPHNLAAAFVPAAESYSWDATAALTKLCQNWLTTPPAGSSFQLASDKPLDVPSDTAVYEFRLALTRSPDMLPDAPDTITNVGGPSFWRVQPVPWNTAPAGTVDPDANLAQISPSDVAATIVPLYKAWYAELASNEDVIVPDLDSAANAVAAAFRKAVGAAYVQDAETKAWSTDRGGAWFVTDEASQASLADHPSVAATVCPLALRPLNWPADTEQKLGDAMETAVAQYFAALEALLGCALPLDIDSSGPVNFWGNYFDAIQGAAKGIDAIITNAAELACPTPRADKQTGLLADIVTALDPTAPVNTGAKTPAREKFVQWLHGQIGAAPSLFGHLQAVLFTDLRNADGTPLDPEFTRMGSTRLTNGTDADAEISTYLDMISYDDHWYAIPEILDSSRYFNEQFSYKTMWISSFDTQVQTLLPQDAITSDAGQNIVKSLAVPGASPANDGTSPVVDLPSELPLEKPVHVFTGVYKATYDVDAMRSLTTIDLASLKVGEIVAGKGGELTLKAAWPVTGEPKQHASDIVPVSALFQIHPDTKNFGSDDYYISIGAIPPDDAPKPNLSTVDADTWTLLQVLASSADAKTQQTTSPSKAPLWPHNLALRLLAPLVVRDLATLTTAATPRNIDELTAGLIKMTIKQSADQLTMDVLDTSGLLEVYYFQPSAPPSSAAKENAGHMLLVTCWLPVWVQASIGLLETRNDRPDLAHAFAEISSLVADSHKVQPSGATTGVLIPTGDF
jgi:hypothetical protein